MKFNDRKDFLYEPDVFKRADVQTALKIHHEYVRKMSGRPYPKFYEVDMSAETVDPVWLSPKGGNYKFTRALDVPAIVTFDKLNYSLARTSRSARQRRRFWCSNLQLAELDYFPMPGDRIFHGGYRHEIVAVEFEPNSFWQQTNVWLGIIFSAEIVPDGDGAPQVNQANVPHSQQSEAGFEEIPSFAGAKPANANPPQTAGRLTDVKKVFASGIEPNVEIPPKP